MNSVWTAVSLTLVLASAPMVCAADPGPTASVGNDAQADAGDAMAMQLTGSLGVTRDRYSLQPQDAASALFPGTAAGQSLLTNNFAATQPAQGDSSDDTPLEPGLLNLQGGVGVDWGQDRFMLPLYHQELRSDRDRALKYDAFGLEWSRHLDSKNLVSLSAQYGDYVYLDQGARDTINSVAAFAWSGELAGESRPRLSSSVYLGDETAKDDAYRSLGRRYYGVTFDGRFTPYRNHTPYASLRLQRSDYLAEDAISPGARHEDYSRLAAGWDWQVQPHWGLRAEANYSLNNSSVESFGYDHTRLLFSTRFDFR